MTTQPVRIIADTVWQGHRILTFHATVWKPLLAQINMHSLTARSAGSSRAVNMAKFRAGANFVPARFTANRRGMTGSECNRWQEFLARSLWKVARFFAGRVHWGFEKCGIAKQHANRILDPWAMVDLVWTMEADYFDYLVELRGAHDAQPEFQQLVLAMRDLVSRSVPTVSRVHEPWGESDPMACAAMCARASYMGAGQRRADDVARGKKLLEDRHMGPFEHWCRFGPGQTKFRFWIQHREDIEPRRFGKAEVVR